MLQIVTTGAMLLSALTAPATPAPVKAPPPPDKMVIDVVAANGSGCPWGTADVTVSPDNTAFTVTYSSYLAQAGAGAQPTDFRKNCQLALNVHVPQGFTYAIAGADYRGFAHLENGASGYQAANYYFQGASETTRTRHYFTGPRDGDWQTTDQVGVGSLSFHRCGETRYLNVNTELRVSSGSSPKNTTSFLTMDSTDGNIATIYHVAWKKC
jgi:uncharacterized protein DUF4360